MVTVPEAVVSNPPARVDHCRAVLPPERRQVFSQPLLSIRRIPTAKLACFRHKKEEGPDMIGPAKCEQLPGGPIRVGRHAEMLQLSVIAPACVGRLRAAF